MPLADPFDLPDWLAETEVVWRADDTVAEASTLSGQLMDPGGQHPALPLRLIAVDTAWPKPVSSDADRRAAHEAWHYGEVVLLDVDGRLVVGVPGAAFSADLVTEALRRFAKAVGAMPHDYAVQLRL